MAQDTAKLLIVCTCGQKMKVPAEALGKTATCVRCGERVKITADGANAPDPIPVDFKAGGGEVESNRPAPDLDDATDLLIDQGLVTQADIDDALMVQRDLPGTIWSLLIDFGCITSQMFHDLLLKEQGLATIDLSNYSVPPEVISLVPENIIRERFVVPVDKLGKLMTLAMVCPKDKSTVKEIEQITGLRVKTMLCSYEAMQNTISMRLPFSQMQAADTISQSLVMEFEKHLNEKIAVRRVFRLIDIAPSLTAMNRLNDISADDLYAITELAQTEPVLAGKTLQLANSAAYGMGGKVDTVGLAASLIGSESLATALQSANPVDYKKRHKAFDFGGYLKRSRFCACASQILAEFTGFSNPKVAYTVGLLHESGRLVLLEALPGGYAQATQNVLGRELHALETRLYKFPNTETCYYQLRRWNVPASILEPIRYQCQPSGAKGARDLTHILFLAIAMTHAFLAGGPLELDSDYDDSLKLFDLDIRKISELLEKARGAFEQA